MSWNDRNSRTNPLRITWIPLSSNWRATGHIGMTLCPGKYQPQSMSGGWNRNLDLDIEKLKESDVGHVISLITFEEMRELKVTNLGKKLGINQIIWHHLPTPDTEVPSEGWMIESIRAIMQLSSNFYSGKRVVVHCKGGISRAGVFASMVLWLLSEIPMSNAIAMIRNMRDNRGINKNQENHLLDFAENFQDWIQSICHLDQWHEGMR